MIIQSLKKIFKLFTQIKSKILKTNTNKNWNSDNKKSKSPSKILKRKSLTFHRLANKEKYKQNFYKSLTKSITLKNGHYQKKRNKSPKQKILKVFLISKKAAINKSTYKKINKIFNKYRI